jgi:hypothetical protein
VSVADVERIEAVRRTFTARRFGAGYDAIQVNRLFDAILLSLSGRSGMPISEAELDPNQFSLVPGGYFEAEVNQLLREVRDIVRARERSTPRPAKRASGPPPAERRVDD